MADDRQLAEIWRTQYTGPLFRKYAGLEQVPEASIGYLARQSRLAVDFCQTMMAPLGLKQYAVNTPIQLPSGETGMMRTHVIAGFGGTPIVTTRVELERKVVEEEKKKKETVSYPLFFYYDPTDGKKAIIEYGEDGFTVITAVSEGGQEQLDAIQIEFAQNSSYYFWTGASAGEVAIVVNTRQENDTYVSKLYGAGGVLVRNLTKTDGYYAPYIKNGIYYVACQTGIVKLVDESEELVYESDDYWVLDVDRTASKILLQNYDNFAEAAIKNDGTITLITTYAFEIESINEEEETIDSQCNNSTPPVYYNRDYHYKKVIHNINDMWFNRNGETEKEEYIKRDESDETQSGDCGWDYTTVTDTKWEDRYYLPQVTLGRIGAWHNVRTGKPPTDGGPNDEYTYSNYNNATVAKFPKLEVFVYGSWSMNDPYTEAEIASPAIYKNDTSLLTLDDWDYSYNSSGYLQNIKEDCSAYNHDGALAFALCLYPTNAEMREYRLYSYYNDAVTDLTELIQPNNARLSAENALLVPLSATMANTVITEEETV